MTKYNYTVKITLKAPIEIDADTEKEALERFEHLYSDLLIDEGSCGSVERDFENDFGIRFDFDDGCHGLNYGSVVELLDDDKNVVFPDGFVQLNLWVSLDQTSSHQGSGQGIHGEDGAEHGSLSGTEQLMPNH
jgi:hypothetical protein